MFLQKKWEKLILTVNMVREAEVNPVVLIKVAKEHRGCRDSALAELCEQERWLNEREMHLHCSNSGSAEQQQELFATSSCQHLFVSEFMKVEQISLIFFFLALKFCTIVSVILAAKMMLECFTFFFQVFELSCSVEVCHINHEVLLLLLAKL